VRRPDRRKLARDYRHDVNDGDDDHAGDGVVRWPAFKHRSRKGRGADKYIVLDVPIREDTRLREEQCDFWEPFFLGSVAGSVPSSHPSPATDDLCGATIIANLTLNHDLTCAGNGLTVGADGIKLNLNGHTITGAGSGVGISVIGRMEVSISGGTVRNFEAGVRVNTSTEVVVKGNEFRENLDGVDCQAGCVGNTIKENDFRNNRARGIMLRSSSSDNVVKENTFTGNRVGILVFGGVDTTVKENIVSTSDLAGIRLNVLATGNRIRANTVTSNPAGIEFIVTPTGSATGNAVVENTIAINTCGTKGPTLGNRFRKNLFEANGADRCP
jgi:parallel beta-helix repeat protein